MLEKVNHAQTVARYRRLQIRIRSRRRSHSRDLPAPTWSPAKAARQLLSHTDISITDTSR
jgi:hypothetical protein